jgi:hypothetical protein
MVRTLTLPISNAIPWMGIAFPAAASRISWSKTLPSARSIMRAMSPCTPHTNPPRILALQVAVRVHVGGFKLNNCTTAAPCPYLRVVILVPGELLAPVVLDSLVDNAIAVPENVEDPCQLTPQLTGRIPEMFLRPLMDVPQPDVDRGHKRNSDVPQVPTSWLRKGDVQHDSTSHLQVEGMFGVMVSVHPNPNPANPNKLVLEGATNLFAPKRSIRGRGRPKCFSMPNGRLNTSRASMTFSPKNPSRIRNRNSSRSPSTNPSTLALRVHTNNRGKFHGHCIQCCS